MPSKQKSPFEEIVDNVKQRVAWESELNIEGYTRVADQSDNLGQLRLDVENCKKCGLHKGRTGIVFGQGNPEANIAFVSDIPSIEEGQAGVPFQNERGALLDRIIAAMDLSRDKVFLCNVIKCAALANQAPTSSETQTCAQFLERQLKLMNPRVIVTLGQAATTCLTGSDDNIDTLRGQFHNWYGISVMPTYHLDYILQNPSAKRPVWEDLKMVRTILR